MYIDYQMEDTIVAISTPPGEGAIGIVRLSGKDAISIVNKIFSVPIDGAESHRIFYGFIQDPDTKEKIDEVIVSVMRAPRSYTRQDVVEINCHGGYIPLNRTLSLVVRAGARPAEPGEFTKRAFLNGRIDLTQAEAVIDIIRAKTSKAEKVALAQLSGALGRKINTLRERLIEILAHIEAYIDFPEEEIEPDSLTTITSKTEDIIRELSEMLKTYEEGRLIKEGVRVAIVGKPNVGKSSLLNTLLKVDRAIVTESPGTTRDIIEEHMEIDGLTIRIMDTAGIREAHDMAEIEGVKRSLKAIEHSDIVLAVFDGSLPLTKEDLEVIEKTKERPTISVLNKSDLPQRDIDIPNAIRISTKTEQGIDRLKKEIYNLSIKSTQDYEGIIITNLRHKTALENSKERLRSALSALKEGLPLELISLELRESVQSLASLTGEITNEDILEKIFSDFCIGK